MKLTSMGKKELIKYLGLNLLLMLLLLYIGGFFSYLTLIPIILSLFVLYFFRDPERIIPDDDDLIVSPADGVVTHIEKIEDDKFFNSSAWRISIFLSIFDVHLNRNSFSGTVKDIIYNKGEFLDVRNPDSLSKNESNTIIFTNNNSKMPLYAIRQVAGLIARRIVCIVKPGDIIAKGEKIGMMKFSSRTDLIIPDNVKLTWNIKVGDKVEAGSTILGKLL